MKLKVSKLDEGAILPTRGHVNDAGVDIYALEDATIMPGETVKVRTGIAIQPDKNRGKSNINVSLIWDRSSLGSRGIHRLAGVIDEDYTGEIIVCLTNTNILSVFRELMNRGMSVDVLQDAVESSAYLIKKGDKIAQLLVQKVVRCDISENLLYKTTRGSGGFGSTGR